MLIDSHAHLQFQQFDGDVQQVIQQAAEAGVSQIVIVGTDVESSRTGIDLAGRNGFRATVGCHPHGAADFSEKTLADLRDLAAVNTVAAVGEAGLDYYRDLSPRGRQMEVFRHLLDLAAAVRLPVVIHDRDAHEDVASTLEAYADRLSGVLLHCYSAGTEFVRFYVDLGFYFSVSGQVTYPRAHELHEAVGSIPIERLLLETDAPYLPPRPVRGMRNEPGYLTHTARGVAELKGMSYEEVCRVTTANASRFFSIEADTRKHLSREGAAQNR